MLLTPIVQRDLFKSSAASGTSELNERQLHNLNNLKSRLMMGDELHDPFEHTTGTGLERFQLRTVTLNRTPNKPLGFVLKGA